MPDSPTGEMKTLRVEWVKQYEVRTNRLVAYLDVNPDMVKRLWYDSKSVAKDEGREVLKVSGKRKDDYYQEIARSIFEKDEDRQIRALVLRDIKKLGGAVKNRLKTCVTLLIIPQYLTQHSRL